MTAAGPEIVGVLDLQGGRVVHAVAGRRDEYQPLCLADGSDDVVEIANAIVRASGVSRLYIADLDGLQGRPRQTDLIARLAERTPIVLDAGFESPADLANFPITSRIRPIIALESWSSPSQLAEATAAHPSLIFSLDLVNAQPRLRGNEWPDDCLKIIERVAQAGVETILILDVSAVGRGQGLVNVELCSAIRNTWPKIRIWTGGGLTLCPSETAAAQRLGINALLVGTRLFKKVGLTTCS